MNIQLSNRDFSYRYSWSHLARPLTLSGTISPILVGTAFAAHKGTIHIHYVIAFLIATLLIQIATNIFNDYFDFKNGQDENKWSQTIIPTTPLHHELPWVATSLLSVAISIGLWLAFTTEFWIMIVGASGVLFGIGYSASSHSLSSIGLGEVVAAVFLGLATTILPYVVQGHPINWDIFLIAIPFSLIISVMILTNNIRDIQKDTGFRHTIAIVVGRKWALRILTMLLIFAYFSVIYLIFLNIIPVLSLIVLCAMPFAIRLRLAFQNNANHKAELQVMKWAAYHHWMFGLLFACSLWIALLF